MFTVEVKVATKGNSPRGQNFGTIYGDGEVVTHPSFGEGVIKNYYGNLQAGSVAVFKNLTAEAVLEGLPTNSQPVDITCQETGATITASGAHKSHLKEGRHLHHAREVERFLGRKTPDFYYEIWMAPAPLLGQTEWQLVGYCSTPESASEYRRQHARFVKREM